MKRSNRGCFKTLSKQEERYWAIIVFGGYFIFGPLFSSSVGIIYGEEATWWTFGILCALMFLGGPGLFALFLISVTEKASIFIMQSIIAILCIVCIYTTYLSNTDVIQEKHVARMAEKEKLEKIEAAKRRQERMSRSSIITEVQYDFFNTNQGVLAVGRNKSDGVGVLKDGEWSNIKGAVSEDINNQYLFAKAVLSVENKKFGVAYKVDFPYIKGDVGDFETLEKEIEEVMKKYEPAY